MRSPLAAARALTFGILTISLASCAANTAYRGIPVVSLTDEQLIAELESAARGFGVEIDRSMYLLAARPEPAYVLTSSTTTFAGSANATYNAYVMPTGYGTAVSGSASGTVQGTAATRYQFTDVRAGERLGNALATAISQSRREAYRRRGLDVIGEYRRRVATRRVETERIIQEFFAQNSNLQNRRPLVAAIAPWAAAEGHTEARATLERTKDIIASLPRGNDLTGTWHGMLAQTNTNVQGETFALNEFVRMDLTQQGGSLTGKGVLGTGEIVELTGQVTQQDIAAAVANTTSAINVKLTAIAAPDQITGSYTGFGAGVRMEGTFTLLR